MPRTVDLLMLSFASFEKGNHRFYYVMDLLALTSKLSEHNMIPVEMYVFLNFFKYFFLVYIANHSSCY